MLHTLVVATSCTEITLSSLGLHYSHMQKLCHSTCTFQKVREKCRKNWQGDKRKNEQR